MQRKLCRALLLHSRLELPKRYIFDNTVGIHPSTAEEFVTMRTLTNRVSPPSKPKTNL
uniref:Uncharacterized protein n=1 Tax=Triticum urartu TaxID=4572 RepID=A0A8R7QWG3_TRIUA